MKASHHFALGALASCAILKHSPAEALALAASSALVDADHVVFYFYYEKRIVLSPVKWLKEYLSWPYYGPRVHFLHNYEALLASGVVAVWLRGIWLYIFLGMLLHMACDQLNSYCEFRYLRIRSLWGDLGRYAEYSSSKKNGTEDEYLLKRRDSWINHLKKRLPEKRYENVSAKCGILGLYPDKPVDLGCPTDQWEGCL